jgi:Ran GTPase-activating protein (RanGAP) involved in mRNA processing and transport
MSVTMTGSPASLRRTGSTAHESSSTLAAQQQGDANATPNGQLSAFLFGPTARCLSGLNCTTLTVPQLVTKLGAVHNDPRFPKFTDRVHERIEHIARVAEQLGHENLDGLPALTFEPGTLVEELDGMARALESELTATKSQSMNRRSVAACTEFLRGRCARGVTCSFSHTPESISQWLVWWLGVAYHVEPLSAGHPTVSGATLTVTEQLGAEAWATLVELLRDPAFQELQTAVGTLVVRETTRHALNVIVPMIGNNWLPTLRYVDLSKNGLGHVHPRGVLKLARALASNTGITGVGLGYNNLGVSGALAVLQEVLASNDTNLESLNLQANAIAPLALGDTSFVHLCDAVGCTVSFLTKLSLANNDLGPDGCRRLLKALGDESAASLPTLQFLDLSATGLQEAGVEHVAHFVSSTPAGHQLRFLNIGWNRAGADGITTLCNALAAPTDTLHLQTLRLHYNVLIGRKGAVAIAGLLKTNATLTAVDLRWTNMGDEGVTSLAEALLTNTAMRELSLAGNDLDQRTEQLVADRLRKRGPPAQPCITAGVCVW